MDKKRLIRFLKQGTRGAYTSLARMYADELASMSVKMALEVIREDLEKESNESVDLNYFSLAKAVSRSSKKVTGHGSAETIQKWKFKDANEIKEGQLGPGEFKLGQDVQ
jgi:hypothetical protein